MTDARLRQVALVAGSLAVADELRGHLGLGEAYQDPGVAAFGLENAVFAVGDCFLEVVSPVRPDTAAGRYRERRGGDAGYMAIFQVPDIAVARQRLQRLGVRVVWQHDLDNVGGTHLHPRDVPGAIVSLDWADPPGSWHWAGPVWSGQVPEHPPGGIVGLVVAAVEPAAVARRWADVLGAAVTGEHGDEIVIAGGAQRLRFAATGEPTDEGIAEVHLAVAGMPPAAEERSIGGVRFRLSPADPGGS